MELKSQSKYLKYFYNTQQTESRIFLTRISTESFAFSFKNSV